MARPQIALVGQKRVGIITDQMDPILAMMKILDDGSVRAESSEFVKAIIHGKDIGSAALDASRVSGLVMKALQEMIITESLG